MASIMKTTFEFRDHYLEKLQVASSYNPRTIDKAESRRCLRRGCTSQSEHRRASLLFGGEHAETPNQLPCFIHSHTLHALGQRPRASVSQPAYHPLWLALDVLLRRIRIGGCSIVPLPFQPVLPNLHPRALTFLLSNQSLTPLDLEELWPNRRRELCAGQGLSCGSRSPWYTTAATSTPAAGGRSVAGNVHGRRLQLKCHSFAIKLPSTFALVHQVNRLRVG
jgi:hypothetical protein